MALRIELINNVVGSKILDYADPVDIHSLGKVVKRSAEAGGVIYEVMLDLAFIKDGRQFMKEAHETAGGIDAIVVVNVYEWDPNVYKWLPYATGQANFNSYDLGEVDIVLNVEQTGIQRRITNMMDIDVDLETVLSENGTDLPVQDVNSNTWHSKALIKESEVAASNNNEYAQAEVFTFPVENDILGGTDFEQAIAYGQLDFTNKKMDELATTFDNVQGFVIIFDSDDLPDGWPGLDEDYITFLEAHKQNGGINYRNPVYEAEEAGTVLNVRVSIKLKPAAYATNTGGDVDIAGEGCMGRFEVKAWFEHRDAEDNVLFIENIGTWNTPGIGGNNRIGDYETKLYNRVVNDIGKGDTFYIYTTYRVYGDYDKPTGLADGFVHHEFTMQLDKDETFFEFIQTTFAPETEVASIMIYEAMEKCVQYYTNRTDAFKSTLLGKVENGYDSDGDLSMLAWLNGRWLRGKYGEKLFTSLKELLDFVNAIGCIEYGFETIDGVEKFVVEKKSYFYKKDTRILSLGKVPNIRKKEIPAMYFNIFEYGYDGKLNISQANARDEFNMLRKRRLPIINTKNKYPIATKVKTSGAVIEYQRRLFISTEDSNYDDEKFAVSMLRDGDNFVPRKDEGFAELNNVLESPSGYNYILQPARIGKNWYEFIASCLVRSLDKIIRFQSGEGNYFMSSRLDTEVEVLAENADVDLTNVEPIWDNNMYSFEAVLTREQMKLITQEPYGYIEFEDLHGNVLEGFISSEGLDHNPNKQMASFKLLKVFRPIA